MIDATHLTAHRTAANLLKKGRFPAVSVGRTNGCLNSKRHAVCNGNGKPMHRLLSEGQMSDYTGARCLLSNLPTAPTLIAERGYDADWFIAALKTNGITPGIPPRKNRTRRRR